MEDKLQLAKEEIGKGDLGFAIRILLQECKQNTSAMQYEHQITLNSSRFSKIQDDRLKGIINLDEYTLVFNQVALSLLEIIKNLQPNLNLDVEEAIEFINNNLFHLTLEGRYHEYDTHSQKSNHHIIEKVLGAKIDINGKIDIMIDMEYVGKTIKKNYFLWYDADYKFHFEAHEIYSCNLKDISSIEILSKNHRFDNISGCLALRFSCFNSRNLIKVNKGAISYSFINDKQDSGDALKNEEYDTSYFEILFLDDNIYGKRLRDCFNLLINHFGSKKDSF